MEDDDAVTLEVEAQALRQAVSGGDFTGARQAALRLAGLLETAVRGLPPAESARRLRDACDLLAWSRLNLRASRARLTGELRHLEGLRQYQARLAELATADAR